MKNFLLATASLWHREMVRFLRQRSRLIGAFASPLIFWLLIGSGIGTSFKPPSFSHEVSYLEYFFPGTILMIVLFTAIFSTISIIEDRREGFLQGVLVSPAPPLAIVFGKILGGATLAVGQGLIFYAFAWPLGIGISLESFGLLLVVLLLNAVALTALGYCIAWPMSSTQGFHAIMNVFLLPMWLLSGALFTIQSASPWIQWVMRLNPLTYGLAAIRQAIDPLAIDIHSFYNNGLVLLSFVVVLLMLATWMTHKVCRL